MASKLRLKSAPKQTVLRDFFGSLDEKAKGLVLLTLNLEADSELYAQLPRETHYFRVATSGNTAWIDRENFLLSMHHRNNLVVTPVEEGSPHERPHELLLLLAAFDLIDFPIIQAGRLRNFSLGNVCN